MNFENLLGKISEILRIYPKLWIIAIKLYGIRNLDINKLKFEKKTLVFPKNNSKNTNYNIFFDAQCLQNLTRQRGIGRYSLNLIKSICRENPNSKFAAFLTPICDEENLQNAYNCLVQLNCKNLDIFIIDFFGSKNKLSYRESEIKLREFLESRKCKTVIQLSCFEKPNTVVPIQRSSFFKKIGMLYDLIPLEFPKELLISRRQKTSYMWQLREMSNCNLLFSISNESKTKWNKYVKVPIPIEVIYGGAPEHDLTSHKGFAERNGILCIGAEQRHKNIKKLINAYAILPIELQLQHPLTIIGIRSIGARKHLIKMSKRALGRIVFLSYLRENDLNLLLENNRVLVMPSLIEGLSLPILEAWSHGLVAIGGLDTVAEEIIVNKKLLFDPKNFNSISLCISKFLLDQIEWEEALEFSKERSNLFTWNLTANRALKFLNTMESA